MAREFDPNNLSAGDVLRILAPTVAVIAVVVLVGRFAPDYVWLLFVLTSVGAYLYVSRLPKKDLAAMVEQDQKFENKIGSLPVIGRIAKPAWRLLNWLVVVFSTIMLILFTLSSITNLL